MKKSIRMALFACAVLSTLAFAGSALAAYTTPKLVVSSLTPQATGSGGAVRIGAVVANTDDPTARVTIYVPTGYQLGTPAVGTKLGDVTATAAAADLGGAILPLTGELQAVAPNAAGATQCGVAASQFWNLHLTAAGQTLDIPLYVAATSAAEQASGYQTKLVVCLPPPDVPVGTPGRAQFGAKLLSASFGVSAITQPIATGDYRWSSLFTPYNPGKGTANPAGTVETQSIRHIPTQLALNYKRAKVTTYTTKKVKGKRVRVKHVRTRVTFSSALTENGTAASGAITTVAAGKKVGAAKGSFIFTGKSVTVTATGVLHHDASVPTGQTAAASDLFYGDLGAAACTKSTAFGGLPCVDATVGSSAPHASVRIAGYLK
ncbi:MAG: hypothetical protein H0X39_17940 [Actinobacteria bacterium]|nr:hypothetical protein [Actinomycetota bacterium]